MPPDHECGMKDRVEALEQANKNHSSTHEKKGMISMNKFGRREGGPA